MSLISYVTKIHFAENVLEDALEAELEACGAMRPLVVTDHDEDRGATLERLQLAIPRRMSAATYVTPARQATEAACAEAASVYREAGCDALIGFGGRAAIDLAKALGVLVSHKGPLRHYVGAEGGAARIRKVTPPLVAVPTTGGSASEAGCVAVLSVEGGPNAALVSPYLVPRIVICDPTLTADLTASGTAASGMDALTHCLETFIASAYNPPADGIALDGLRRAATHIERAVADGSDLEARREMMAASLNGALAQQKGLGGVHAISHALGGMPGRDAEHGALNAILLPVVLEFNAPAVAGRYDDIRRELMLPAAADLGEAFFRLRERIGLPARLSDLGVDAATIACAAPFSASDHANRTNPRKATAEDYLGMMHAAL